MDDTIDSKKHAKYKSSVLSHDNSFLNIKGHSRGHGPPYINPSKECQYQAEMFQNTLDDLVLDAA